MSVQPRIAVDRIPLRYIDSPEQLPQMYVNFENQYDSYREQRVDPVTDSFMMGTLLLLSADQKFEQGQHSASLDDFQQATEHFQRASRVLAKSEELSVPADYHLAPELERRAIYCQARITHAEALAELKALRSAAREEHRMGESELKKLYQERLMVKKVLELSAASYQEEMNYSQSHDDFYHSMLALRNMYKVNIRLAEQEAELDPSIEGKRAGLYRAMTWARKVIFLGGKIPQPWFVSMQSRIRKLTVEKYLERADHFWQVGLELSANQQFKQASRLFWTGVRIYENLDRIEARQEFKLQGQMFRVTALENDAKGSLSMDKNREASQKFQQALELMQVLITTVKELGNTDLVYLFQIQSNFFSGMDLFSKGILEYDDENYKGALRSIKMAQRSIKAVLTNARKLDNKPLITSCKDALRQIETYLETLTLLAED